MRSQWRCNATLMTRRAGLIRPSCRLSNTMAERFAEALIIKPSLSHGMKKKE